MLGLTETWLTRNISDNEISLPGYRLFRLDRYGSNDVQACGGVCMYVREELHAVQVCFTNSQNDKLQSQDPTLELLAVRLKKTHLLPTYTVGCLYRPPSSPANYWQSLGDALEKLECEDLVIMGDLNVDMLADCGYQKRHLEEVMASFDLRNTVCSATRTTATTQTCIDLIMTNSQTHCKTVVEECALSDHELVMAQFSDKSVSPGTNTSKLISSRCYKNFTMEEFRQLLQNNKITASVRVASVDKMWSHWCESFMAAVNVMAPVKIRCPRRRRCLFMTPELLKIIHDRKRLYRQLCKPGADRDTLFPVYRRLRNDGNNLYRQLRNVYYQHCCLQYAKAPKQLWDLIKTACGRSKSRLCPLPSPNALNSFFAEMVSDTSVSHEIPLGPANESYFVSFKKVTADRVEKMLENLNLNKAAGSDEILPIFLRGCADMLAPSLAHLFNESLISGIVPSGFKEANVTPILKSTKLDATCPSSYRGISLLPIISKLLEKIVEEELSAFLEEENIFSDLQFGFRRGRSAEDLLVKAVSDWSRNKDGGLTTVVAFIDLSKAFDKVKHQDLLLTLQQCGIGGTALKWFASYLSDRRQRVCTKTAKCPASEVQQGVPQGSILGPLLFNLCLAKLPKLVACIASIQSPMLLLFADDKTLYAAHKSPAAAAVMVSRALSAICNDIRPKGLSVNLAKTVYMVIGSSASSVSVSVECEDHQLKQVTTHTCLGVNIDNRLSWSDYVDQIASKVAQRIGCLWRIRRQLSEKARRLYFLGLIQPCLEYCAVVTATQITSKDRERLLALFRRGVRAACGATRDADIQPLLRNFGLCRLEERWLLRLLLFGYRCFCKYGSAADCLKSLLEQQTSSRCTRGMSSGAVRLPWRTTKCGRNAVDFRIAVLWNHLPFDLRNSPDAVSFKCNVLKYFSDPVVFKRYLSFAFGPASDL